MRIGINLLTLTQERFGGVEQYIKNLIAHLADSGENLTLFLFLSTNIKNIFPYHEKIQIRMLKDPAQIHESIRQCQLDLWFCPMHSSYISDVRVPCIVTIHDVLHTAYPHFVQGGLEENNRYYHRFAPSFRKVITVSAFSRNAIANQLSIPKEKIHAIHLSAPAIFDKAPADVIRKKVKQKYQLPDTYAIYPSSFNPHKNHQNLLKAILILREKHNTALPLILTGYANKRNRIYQSVLRFIEEHSLENQVRVLGYVKPDEMPSLYWNSSFLVFPSLYEGFGIPLVEALKAQRPIACSNKGSIPEVAGDAALYFNPERPEEMALRMKEMLNPLTRKKLWEEGKLRSQHFSWKKTAEETLHVFRSVIKKR
ncbi:glycosyltransferase family 4 protein [Cytobacillus sp. FSL H8-0458]|uniref:glycosyltransferase family 4 protein n=1 Tax=Cytobacillus sp. FSL H8-0458 TaxID=2975346 RepID=UPI0030F65AB5